VTVKGRVIIEVLDNGQVRYAPDPTLSRLEANAAVLEAWRLVAVQLDLGWYRTIQRSEEEAAAQALAGSEQWKPGPQSPTPDSPNPPLETLP
jgi:hypothetical protein